MPEKELNARHNRCNCMNRVHGFANKVVPELLEELSRGFKLTVSYNLHTKDYNRLQAVIDVHKGIGYPNRTGAFISANRYNITLGLLDKYPGRFHTYGVDGGFTYEYYKRTVYLWNIGDAVLVDFQPLPLHTYQEMDKASTRIKQIENDISECQNELLPLKRLLGK